MRSNFVNYSIAIAVTAIVSIVCFWLILPKQTMPVNLMLPISLPQTIHSFLPQHADLDKPLLSIARQDKYKKDFLTRFYSPWNKKDSNTTVSATADHQHTSTILEIEQHLAQHYQNKTTYDSHYQPHSSQWLDNIAKNMELDTFPNVTQHSRGIMINNAALRELPTSESSYNNILQPGEGYPFDDLQESAVYLGSPIHIIHQTKDKKWLLIKAAGLLGWVEHNNVSYVDQTFIDNWKRKPLATLTTYQPITNTTQHQSMAIYPGTILPMIIEPTTNQIITVLYPKKATSHQTSIVSRAASSDWQPWPISPTLRHFVNLVETLLGIPYGWGDLHFHPDCSGLLRSLYNTVGIWLPRNSSIQAHYAGKLYSLPLTEYPTITRETILNGKNNQIGRLTPFLTFISFGKKQNHISHIAIYVGRDNTNHPIIFHSIWGLGLLNKQQKQIGRMIVGQSILSRLDLGVDVVIPQHPQWHIDNLLEKPEFNITKLNG